MHPTLSVATLKLGHRPVRHHLKILRRVGVLTWPASDPARALGQSGRMTDTPRFPDEVSDVPSVDSRGREAFGSAHDDSTTYITANTSSALDHHVDHSGAVVRTEYGAEHIEVSEAEAGEVIDDNDDISDIAAAEALDRLVRYHNALEQLGDLADGDLRTALQGKVDQSLAELGKIIVGRMETGDADDRTVLLRKITDAYNDPGASSQEKSTWVAAAIVSGIAMLAATGAAPLGALAVGDVVWKETVKAAISGLLTGVATLAVDRALYRDRADEGTSARANGATAGQIEVPKPGTAASSHASKPEAQASDMAV